MTVSTSQSGSGVPLAEVLTLAEAASFLRVTEQALIELVADQAIPAQKIGGEWRFLRRALEEWLRYGPRYFRDLRTLPHPLVFDLSVSEDLILLIERRVIEKLAAVAHPPLERGSKQAVLQHFGVFRDDEDLEERLADVRKRRERGG